MQENTVAHVYITGAFAAKKLAVTGCFHRCVQGYAEVKSGTVRSITEQHTIKTKLCNNYVEDFTPSLAVVISTNISIGDDCHNYVTFCNGASTVT